MPSKKKGTVVRSDEQLVPLTDLITSLDSVRAYRRRGSQNLEEKFKRVGGMGYSDLRRLWHGIEGDVKAIVDMPLNIPEVPRLIRLNYALRLVGRLFFIMLVILLAARLVRAWRSVLGEALGGNLPLLISVVIGAVVAMNGEVIIDYIIRRKVVDYETRTEDRYKKHVNKVRDAVQTVIDRLARESKQSRKDPSELPFHLFFDDYDNIEVISEKTPRSMLIFKRKFKVYTAIVKSD